MSDVECLTISVIIKEISEALLVRAGLLSVYGLMSTVSVDVLVIYL